MYRLRPESRKLEGAVSSRIRSSLHGCFEGFYSFSSLAVDSRLDRPEKDGRAGPRPGEFMR
jgi:hypothetical protein